PLHRGEPWQPPLLLQARLRFSHPAGQFAGTAGLGFWSGHSRRPQWLWFYYASPPAVFSLLPGPPHGLKASALAAKGGELAATAVVPLLKAPPGMVARPAPASEMTLNGRLLTGWHTYRIAWLANEALFQDNIDIVTKSIRQASRDRPPGT
ncbi:MAG: hypothetical protein GYA47_03735, partial [Desulfovibrio sp.]|nr:hypothetical protein [Desulfovibrio sp.]